MPVDGPFVLPHAGPKTFASFSDVFNRALAAFKVVDDIGFIVWFQGVLGWRQAVRRVFTGLCATNTPCLDKMRATATDTPCI